VQEAELPEPMVSVFCTMEVAINSVPAGPLTVVSPTPVIVPTVFTPSEISSPVAVLLLTMFSERFVVVSVNGSAVPPASKVPPLIFKSALALTVTGAPWERAISTQPGPTLSVVPDQVVNPVP
jgi:hypothetical protein